MGRKQKLEGASGRMTDMPKRGVLEGPVSLANGEAVRKSLGRTIRGSC